MNKRQILKDELQNWFYKKMSVLPSENLLNNLTDKIYYNKKLNLFDVGKQLLCVDDTWFSYDITKGKKYELIKKDKNHFYIINDSGKEFGYKKNRFVKL